ncbi:MAG: hypothetical protein AAF327_01815 [Cyanobacteria bacterium P01_A01_bin.37]
MQIEIPTEQSVIQEALQVLMTHMEPLKVARFIVACKLGEGDYLKMKDQLFAGETVNSLYDKIQAFEKADNP